MADVPRHIGYILDGNRRWAKQRGLPTFRGHMAGVTALEDVVRATVDAGVEYVSFYTWSTENWNRAEDEVRATLKIIRSVFKGFLKQLILDDCKFVVLGDRESIPKDIKKIIEEAEHESRNGTRATLVMCFNYGGQQEIVAATKRAIESGIDPESLDVDAMQQFMDHAEVPPCDLIVRTSGEQRLSNFMLWRSAYSELLFLDKYWPDMTKDDVSAIIEEYNTRNRRHGG